MTERHIRDEAEWAQYVSKFADPSVAATKFLELFVENDPAVAYFTDVLAKNVAAARDFLAAHRTAEVLKQQQQIVPCSSVRAPESPLGTSPDKLLPAKPSATLNEKFEKLAHFQRRGFESGESPKESQPTDAKTSERGFPNLVGQPQRQAPTCKEPHFAAPPPPSPPGASSVSFELSFTESSPSPPSGASSPDASMFSGFCFGASPPRAPSMSLAKGFGASLPPPPPPAGASAMSFGVGSIASALPSNASSKPFGKDFVLSSLSSTVVPPSVSFGKGFGASSLPHTRLSRAAPLPPSECAAPPSAPALAAQHQKYSDSSTASAMPAASLCASNDMLLKQMQMRRCYASLPSDDEESISEESDFASPTSEKCESEAPLEHPPVQKRESVAKVTKEQDKQDMDKNVSQENVQPSPLDKGAADGTAFEPKSGNGFVLGGKKGRGKLFVSRRILRKSMAGVEHESHDGDHQQEKAVPARCEVAQKKMEISIPEVETEPENADDVCMEEDAVESADAIAFAEIAAPKNATASSGFETTQSGKDAMDETRKASSDSDNLLFSEPLTTGTHSASAKTEIEMDVEPSSSTAPVPIKHENAPSKKSFCKKKRMPPKNGPAQDGLFAKKHGRKKRLPDRNVVVVDDMSTHRMCSAMN